MKDFNPDLADLLSVAAAVLDRDGLVVRANPGFLRLLSDGYRQGIGTKAARFFIQPSFAMLQGQLAAGTDGYRGLLTIGEYSGKTRTLRGRVWKTDTGLRVLAEYDVVELERIIDAFVGLNAHSSQVEHSLAHANLALRQQETASAEAALTDALTGVGNRRRMDQALAVEIARVRRAAGSKLSAIMVDVDHFKRVNDVHGHAAGDKVLAEVGSLLRSQARETDIIARFGGEEFVILLPDATLSGASANAERLRASLAVQTIAPLPAPVTASFGVAELHPGEDAESLLGRIDAALYQAKQEGRNRVVESR